MTFELCPCLDSIFGGVPDETALQTLADLGYRHFEFWDWRSHDLAVLGRAEPVYGLRPAVFSANTFAESLLVNDAHSPALTHVRRSVEVAIRLGTGALVIHVGYSTDRPRGGQWRAAAGAVREAAEIAAGAGIVLLVEPLNSVVDHPGYFLNTLDDARRLIDEVAHPSVRLLLDIYHMWLMHPDLSGLLPETIPVTGHVHLADVPGRHEPGSGTIPWPRVMAALTGGGYAGLIGLEYFPSQPDVSLSLIASSNHLRLAVGDAQ